MQERYDIAIVGAGVVGSLIARELSRFPLRTALVERCRDVGQGTTKANSAIVHAGFDAKPGSWKARMNVEGARMMPALCQTLHVPFEQCGSLVVAFAPEELPELDRLLERGRQNGVEGLRLLSAGELRAMEPGVNPGAAGALYAPTGGIVCPFGLAIAAAECAVSNGVELYRNFDVEKIEQSGDFILYAKDGRSMRAAIVINAAGVHADDLARMIGDESFHIRPRRGEYLLLDSAQAGVVKRTVFQCPSKMGKGVLITPTVHSNVLIGPNAVNVEGKDDLSTTDAGLGELREAMRRSVPDFVVSGVITSFTGLRAHCDRDDFILEASARHPRFLHAAGIESPGLTAAPAIAAYMKALTLRALGPEVKAAKTDWLPGRPKPVRLTELSREEQHAVIAENPAYGHIICRCETVSEGEILDAIRAPAGARDVDGVKRRTRAGAGRCQGGFCGAKVVELLSRELKLPMEEITKSGGGSRILVGKTKTGEGDGDDV
ncbi:MAG: NAD(P)/FAD-dependent oxidoreductase [Oscillospiraceae bacterium]|nr:NAD(P)/FAD-dependent oxidoreductase [Oscillospiraceae bacterium]